MRRFSVSVQGEDSAYCNYYGAGGAVMKLEPMYICVQNKDDVCYAV